MCCGSCAPPACANADERAILFGERGPKGRSGAVGATGQSPGQTATIQAYSFAVCV